MITARECIAVIARHRELLSAIAHLKRFEAAHLQDSGDVATNKANKAEENSERSGDLAEVQRRLAIVRKIEAEFRKRWQLDETPTPELWWRCLLRACRSGAETPEERLEVSHDKAPHKDVAPEPPLSATVTRSGSFAPRCGATCGKRPRGTKSSARSMAICGR